MNRAYGGHLAHGVVRERIIRAFLIEEQKIVKKVRLGTACAACRALVVPLQQQCEVAADGRSTVGACVARCVGQRQ